MKALLNLFISFAKIGLFTLGGGYAMLPLMERELVDKQHLFERKDFLDMVAVAQAAPGVMAVNLSILAGHKTKGFWGAFFAALGAAFPSFVIILLIAVSLPAVILPIVYSYRFYQKQLADGKAFVRTAEDGNTPWICLACGQLIANENAPEHCPTCGHPRAYFARFSE